METKHAAPSVEFCAYERGYSAIFITAALAALALIAVLLLRVGGALQAQNAGITAVNDAGAPQFLPSSNPLLQSAATTTDATTSDPIAAIGPAVMQQLQGAYQQMQATGIYSSSTAQAFGQSLAPYVAAQVQYPTVDQSALKIDRDTSYARMLRYRGDLQVAFAPLLKNTEPEYAIFASYVQTGDASYLAELRRVAGVYRAVASSTVAVAVPQDAATQHLALVNSIEEFAAVLDALALHAQDPFASVALLRSYDQAESDVLYSFNALAMYYKSKQP